MRFKGFTLIELIVVIAIIAILAAIVAPNAFKAIEKAKISGAIEDFRSIKTSAMAYYADAGSWPVNCTTPTQCGAIGFISENTTVVGWDGPYLEKWPQTSKWGGNVTYTNDPTGQRWNLTQAGERFVNMTGVPQDAARKIDLQSDGARNNTRSDVRYSDNVGPQTLFGIIISRDGTID